jgi:hypothetical protein
MCGPLNGLSPQCPLFHAFPKEGLLCLPRHSRGRPPLPSTSSLSLLLLINLLLNTAHGKWAVVLIQELVSPRVLARLLVLQSWRGGGGGGPVIIVLTIMKSTTTPKTPRTVPHLSLDGRTNSPVDSEKNMLIAKQLCCLHRRIRQPREPPRRTRHERRGSPSRGEAGAETHLKLFCRRGPYGHLLEFWRDYYWCCNHGAEEEEEGP